MSFGFIDLEDDVIFLSVGVDDSLQRQFENVADVELRLVDLERSPVDSLVLI